MQTRPSLAPTASNRGRRVLWRGAVLLGAVGASGCYTYASPPSLTLAAGTPVALELTDAGRAAMAERIGPGVLRIKGKLVTITDDNVVLAMERVDVVGSHVTPWAGEEVAFDRCNVSAIKVRKLSTGRTILAAAIAAGAVVGGLMATNLVGSNNGTGSDGGIIPRPPDDN